MSSALSSSLSPSRDPLPRTSVDAPERAPSPSRRHRFARFGARAAGAVVLVTGLIGVLHLPIAAPLLRRISPASVCPVMRGSPARIDRGHALTAAAVRSSATSVAPARPAVGFKLDVTRKRDVDAWASNHDISCASIAGNENLQRCTHASAAAVGQPDDLGALEEVTFEFQTTGELVSVQTMRRHLTAAQAAHTAETLERKAAGVLGAPSTSAGAATVAHLSRGLLATYVATHTFNDYRATVSATNLAETGFMVREEYLSAR